MRDCHGGAARDGHGSRGSRKQHAASRMLLPSTVTVTDRDNPAVTTGHGHGGLVTPP